MRNPIFWIKKELGIRRTYAWARKGQGKQALTRLNQLLEQAPADLDLLMQKAWVLADLKEYEEARGVVEQALEAHPSHATLHLIRGEVLYALSLYEEAKDTLLKALALSGDNIRVEYALGLAYVALGDMEKASQYFESSVKYDRTLVQSRLLAMAELFLLRETRRSSSGQ